MKAKRKVQRLISMMICLVLCLTLLPATAFAGGTDTKTEINSISATCDFGQPTYGGTARTDYTFTSASGSEVEFSTSMRMWEEKGDLGWSYYSGDTLGEGTYRFKVAFYVGMAYEDEYELGENLTATVNGTAWTIENTGSIVYLCSPEYTVKEYYTVNFDMNGHTGAGVVAQTVKSGSKATKPGITPTSDGWIFDGWCADADGTTAFDFTKAITADTTVYAKWHEIEKYTVNFDMNGHGSAIDAQTVTSGSKAKKPSDTPTASGWVFDGWYADKDCTTAFDFTKAITEDTTVYAKWLEVEVINITYNIDAGTKPSMSMFTITPGYELKGILVKDGVDGDKEVWTDDESTKTQLLKMAAYYGTTYKFFETFEVGCTYFWTGSIVRSDGTDFPGKNNTINPENIKVYVNGEKMHVEIYAGYIVVADDEISFSAAGWKKVDGKWFYYTGDGTYATGWENIGGKWYYFNGDGVMQTGWVKVRNNWFYLNASGAMQTGWVQIGSNWYYMKSSGIMVTGWSQIGSAWYYFNGSGVMQTGWQQIGSAWYYFNGSGAMQTGWVQIGSTWYYFTGSGAMATDWQNIGGKYYYFYSSGAMAVNTWIGNYYVDSSGVWTKSK